ncbi:MAG: DUF3499 domain-containing protein [Propionibacteriaceae bacterium]|nr:DUF3499 domain-containing protein [Propionibacteriaceae bacterium]
MRTCSRTACGAPAVATLTYVYADSTAVLGPLALAAEPGTYDLCARHAERTSAPRGWEIIKLPLNGAAPAAPAPQDDLMALADAVRAIGLRHDELPPPARAAQLPAAPATPELPASSRGGHLRLVPTAD